MPASPNHKDRLEKISKIGIPAEKPKNSMISARRSKNAVNAAFHPVFCAEVWPVCCVVIRLLFSIKSNCCYSIAE